MFSVHDAHSDRSLVTITNEQATKIIHSHFDQYRGADVRSLQLRGNYQRHADSTVAYLIDVVPSEPDDVQRVVCFLILSAPAGSTNSNTTRISNPPSAILALINLIRDNTDVPMPNHSIDLSLSIVPYHYLLSPPLVVPEGHSFLSLSDAREKGVLGSAQHARFDMRIGQYLGQLHTNVQNDWFGLPNTRPEPKGIANVSAVALFAVALSGDDTAYSWQETFVVLFEALLDRVEQQVLGNGQNIAEDNVNGSGDRPNGRIKPKHALPSKDIHRSLSRAISFFLFDDVQAPSLIVHTLSADDIFITVADKSKAVDGLPPITVPIPDPEIAYVLPNLTHALWGDPLLEAMFSAGPSQAMLEGYEGAGGGRLVVFPRQKTKKLWYTLFSALLVLAEEGTELSEVQAAVDQRRKDKVERAWETVEKCVEALKDAPCY